MWDHGRQVGEHFERLESRTLLSGTPLTISQADYLGGTQLQIHGSRFDDQITLKRIGDDLVIKNGSWTTTIAGDFKSILIDGGAGNDSIRLDPSVDEDAILYGSAGNDTLIGGSGDDRIYGGDGKDRISGGAGDDTIITIGGCLGDAAVGGEGNDSFWVDPGDRLADISGGESLSGAVHRVNSFMSYSNGSRTTAIVGKEPRGENLADPLVTSSSLKYRNFSNHPLFGDAGPAADDVSQGAVGDCYFLSVLSSVAKVDPQLIRQTVADLGDGSYAVQFWKNGVSTFVRVDADLPTYSWGAPAYADLGAQGSLWVAIVEKAFTFFRSSQGTYKSISAGWMSEAYRALGRTSTSTFWSDSSSELMFDIAGDLAGGKSVTYAVSTPSDGAPLIGSHAYMVDSLVRSKTGAITGLRLRNPWGVDGAGSDGKNDGYVTITAAQAQACLLGLTSAVV